MGWCLARIVIFALSFAVGFLLSSAGSQIHSKRLERTRMVEIEETSRNGPPLDGFAVPDKDRFPVWF